LKNLGFERTEYWLGWKNLNNNENLIEKIDFRSFDSNLASLLNDDKRLENLMTHIYNEILKTLFLIEDKI